MPYLAETIDRSSVPATKLIFAAVVLTLLCSARSAAAQNCPFDSSDAVPDTLDPLGYYPLAVGNVWESVTEDGGRRTFLRREEVLADSLVDNKTFYGLRRTIYYYDEPVVEVQSVWTIHIAATDSGIVQLLPDIEQSRVDYRFGGDFNSCYEGFVHQGVPEMVSVFGGENAELRVTENGRDVTYVLPASKEFVITGGSEEYGHGVGPIGGTGDPSVTSELVFAVVGDRSLGTPLDSLFVFAVGTDPVEPVTRSEMHVYPSPAQSTVTVEIGRTESVDQGRLSIYDMLGRRVLSANLSSQTRDRFELDVGNMPAGVYLAVVTNGSTRKVRTFVVHR